MQKFKLNRINPIEMVAVVVCVVAFCLFHPDLMASELKIIDAHMHTDFTGKKEQSSGIEITREQLLKQMREAGVVAGISHTNQKGTDFVDLRKDQIYSCAGTEAKVDVSRIEKGLKVGIYRCMKVYLGYVHQFASDPNYRPIYQLARKYKVPVVFHTGDTYTPKGKLKYSDPLTVDEVAADYPDVDFIIAHAGNPWIQTAAEIAYNKPNVYLEVSALLVGDLSQMKPESIKTYVEDPIRWAFGYLENPKKMMFGTDWPLTYQKDYIAAIKRAIPKEHWNAVFYENAKRVFKLPLP